MSFAEGRKCSEKIIQLSAKKQTLLVIECDFFPVWIVSRSRVLMLSQQRTPCNEANVMNEERLIVPVWVMSRSSSSIVNSKYGPRALIEMPPIALEGDKRRYEGYEAVPSHMFRRSTGDHRRHNTKVYHQPPRAAQPSLTVPPVRRYEEPLMVNQPPQYQPPPPPPPPQQPQLVPPPPSYHRPPPSNNLAYPYSNIVQPSNIVPYSTLPQSAPPAVPSLLPAAPPVYAPPYHHAEQNDSYDPSGEVHIYYGPNGERISGPMKGQAYPTDFTLEGTLEYGKMVSIKVRNSSISYRDLPQFVLRDLEKMYGMIESTEVKIVAQGGEYNIYASPKLLDNSSRHYGYMYEPRVRSHDLPRRRDSAQEDIYTKRYRYGTPDDTLVPGESDSPKTEDTQWTQLPHKVDFYQ